MDKQGLGINDLVISVHRFSYNIFQYQMLVLLYFLQLVQHILTLSPYNNSLYIAHQAAAFNHHVGYFCMILSFMKPVLYCTVQ